MHKGPVTVLTTDYGERLDNQPVSRSAMVDGVPDFVNLYEYDDQDRLVALTQTGQGGSAVADKLVTFDYNDSGQFVTITRYASLDGTHLVAVSDYAYDQYGRPTGLVHHQPPSGQPATQQTLPTDNRQRATNNGQRPTDHGQLPTDNPLAAYTWTWEGGGDTVEVVHVDAASAPQFRAGWMLPFGGTVRTSREVEITPLPDHVWTFDTAFLGHQVQTTSTDGTVDYQYDPRGQLLGADYTAGAGLLNAVGAGLPTSVGAGLLTVPPDEFYTYDANGNRTNPGYITGDHNRLLSDGTYDYEYDAEGNRTRRTDIATGEVTEYHWDHRNRLVRVSTRTTDNGPLTTDTSYAYDYLNRWIARSHDPDGDGPQDFADTYFVYDGTPPNGSLLDRAAVTMENIGQIVLHFESDGQGDPQLAHRYLWGPAVDQILSDEQVTDPTAPGNIVWPLTDHLNTVRDLAVYDADTDTTTIVNHLIYDAYGRITSQSDPDETTLFAFTARPFDPATGLQNNLNRWYDAEVGRWISEDPIGFEGGDANLYRYVENEPTVLIDPSGLELLRPSQPFGMAPEMGSGRLPPAYFPYPKPHPIGYQGIGGMGNMIDRAKIDAANAVLDEMRAALDAATVNLSLAERAEARAELERVIRKAVTTPTWFLGQPMESLQNQCLQWAQEVLQVASPRLKYVTVEGKQWEYPVGAPTTDWWLGHMAVEVTIGDQVFYLDSGWWGHAFRADRVPEWLVKEICPDRSHDVFAPLGDYIWRGRFHEDLTEALRGLGSIWAMPY